MALIGANGAGKSTLMMTIFGKPRAKAGRIVFDGTDITEVADARDRADCGSRNRRKAAASSRG